MGRARRAWATQWMLLLIEREEGVQGRQVQVVSREGGEGRQERWNHLMLQVFEAQRMH